MNFICAYLQEKKIQNDCLHFHPDFFDTLYLALFNQFFNTVATDINEYSFPFVPLRIVPEIKQISHILR
jgi:hypothetical protein